MEASDLQDLLRLELATALAVPAVLLFATPFTTFVFARFTGSMPLPHTNGFTIIWMSKRTMSALDLVYNQWIKVVVIFSGKSLKVIWITAPSIPTNMMQVKSIRYFPA